MDSTYRLKGLKEEHDIVTFTMVAQIMWPLYIND